MVRSSHGMPMIRHKKIKKTKAGEGSDSEQPEAVDGRSKRRWHPGTVALRDINYYQKKYHGPVLKKAPVKRLIREIGDDYKANMRWTTQALLAVHTAAEAYTTEILEKANTLSCDMGSKGLTIKALLALHRAQVSNGGIAKWR